MTKKIAATNKKALHNYHIDEKLEAGMVLTGPEVKSLRAGRANLTDGYCSIEKGQCFLHNAHITHYTHATHTPQDPLRKRKLLLHKREIRKLTGRLQEKGFALIPLKIYFIDNGKAKVELGLARGKKLFDKRADIKKKELDREVARHFRRGK